MALLKRMRIFMKFFSKKMTNFEAKSPACLSNELG